MFRKSIQKVSSAASEAMSRVESSITGFPSGIKVIRNYDIGAQVASGGPGLLFKIYSAQSKRDKSAVAVWILDKRHFLEERKTPKADFDAYVELVKRGAAQMSKLHHPRILRVIEPLEESRSGIAFATEPVFASLANAMRKYDNLPKLPLNLREFDLRSLPLEMKHGILQISEALVFLHTKASIVHRGLSPEAVIITAKTFDWKLSLFEFSSVHGYQQSHQDKQMFEYKEFDSRGTRTPWHLPKQPSLDFTAPELVAGVATSPNSDMFSLGALIYELYSGHPLLQSNGNILTYKMEIENMARAGPNYNKGNPFPPKLLDDMGALLHANPSNRLSAERFAASNFFIEDGLLRALKFLDHFLERDTMHKSQFLQTLQTIWQGFEPRILQFKVIPPLMLELRNETLRPLILPILLPLLDHVSKDLYERQIAPLLQDVMAIASGDALLTLVRETERLVHKSSARFCSEHILPMSIRALLSDQPPLQEEAFQSLPCIAKTVEYGQVKKEILPRIHAVATKTTHARVRICAVECMGELANNLDKHTLEQMCLSLSGVLKAESSGPVVSVVVDVADKIAEKTGVEIVAFKILPMLCPILLNTSLNIDEFKKLSSRIKAMIQRVEDLRLRELGESAALKQDAQRMIGDGGLSLGQSSPSSATSWDNPNSLGFGQTALSDRNRNQQSGLSAAAAPGLAQPSLMESGSGSPGFTSSPATANIMDDPFGIAPSQPGSNDTMSFADGRGGGGGYNTTAAAAQPATGTDPFGSSSHSNSAGMDGMNVVIPPMPAGWKPGQPVNLPNPASSSDPMFSTSPPASAASMDPYGMAGHQHHHHPPPGPASSAAMGYTPPQGMPAAPLQSSSGPYGAPLAATPPQAGVNGMSNMFGGMSLQPGSSQIGGGDPYGSAIPPQSGSINAGGDINTNSNSNSNAMFASMSIAPPPTARQTSLPQPPPPAPSFAPMMPSNSAGGGNDPFNLMG